jgi:hypothetical protein
VLIVDIGVGDNNYSVVYLSRPNEPLSLGRERENWPKAGRLGITWGAQNPNLLLTFLFTGHLGNSIIGFAL